MTENNIEDIMILQEQNESLLNDLFLIKSKPRGRIGHVFLIIGAILFAFSIDYSSSVISFLSLGTLFWGGLFLYINPNNFVREDILFSCIEDTKSIYNQFFEFLDLEELPVFISKKNLSETEEVHMLIPKNTKEKINYDNIMSETESNKFFKIHPLGFNLVKLMEKESKKNFFLINIDKLSKIIEKVLIDDLEILTEFEYNFDDSIIQIKLAGSIFDNSTENNNKRYLYLDYLTSAIACSYAKSIGKPLVINKIVKNKEEKNITIKIIG